MIFIPDSFNSDTTLVLVNAIYFKSPWKYPFESRNTKRANFYVGKRPIRVMTMVSEDGFPYGDLPDLGARIVSLPYKVDLVFKNN